MYVYIYIHPQAAWCAVNVNVYVDIVLSIIYPWLSYRFLHQGLTEAPKAEAVPMSPMVNREMHKAGSCLPCLCLEKMESHQTYKVVPHS